MKRARLLNRKIKLLPILFAIWLFMPYTARAQEFTHQLIRRIVVFPLQSDASLGGLADDTWWQVREELTKSRRFLVASKQFLIKSDVYQPRGTLEPADCLILGKLLDAHALITMRLKDRKLTLDAYDAGNGLLLWRRNVSLHPSLTVQDQLAGLARKAIDDFVASVPYQGFTIVDSLIGQPVYSEGQAKLAQVDLGLSTGAQLGDLVQWVRLVSNNSLPLFQGGAKMTVYSEGKIVRIEQGLATVEISRITDKASIAEYSLVRVPREAERLQNEFSISETPKTTLNPELAAPEAGPMERVAKERKPLTAALSFVGSIAAFLLLAF